MSEDHEDRGNMMRSAFRRSSLSVDHGKQYIERQMMPVIFNSMGQKVDEIELNKFIDEVDSEQTGNLDFDRFMRVCNRFLKNPAAMAKFKGDEFAFKNLINLADFDE